METSKNLFGFTQIRKDIKVDTTLIFEGVRKELEEYLLKQSVDRDSTDGAFDFLATLSYRLHENLTS